MRIDTGLAFPTRRENGMEGNITHTEQANLHALAFSNAVNSVADQGGVIVAIYLDPSGLIEGVVLWRRNEDGAYVTHRIGHDGALLWGAYFEPVGTNRSHQDAAVKDFHGRVKPLIDRLA